MSGTTVALRTRTRRIWALRLARHLCSLRLWPLVDWLLGLVRMEYRANGWTVWTDMGMRVVRRGDAVSVEKVV
jgi:hypothetical protein